MRALILAAGRGSRLGPLTRDRPKALLEVARRTLLEHCLERLAPFEPEGIRVVVGWKGERIEERFGEEWRGVPLSFVRQRELLGLGHAVAIGAEGLREPFLAMHGDAVFAPGADLSPVVHRFREWEDASAGSGRPPGPVVASILTERRAPRAISAGAVRVDGSGRAVAFAERPSPRQREWGRVAAGFYLLDPAVAEACRAAEPSPRGEYELTDALGRLAAGARLVLASDLEGERVNVNTPADLAAAERLLGGSSALDGSPTP
jgi:dTDP-glucose pyrophosphorylase